MYRFRIAIFLITFLVFSRLTVCDFTFWDDQQTIHQNPKLNPPTWDTLGYYWTTAGENETMGLYVPVTYTLWSGLAKLARRSAPGTNGITLNPMVFHTANVLLHAITAVVVFELLICLFIKNRAGACRPDFLANSIDKKGPGRHAPALSCAIAALLFALHPVQVESVGWVSGTKDVLCGLLSISALVMYVRSVQVGEMNSGRSNRSPGRWRYVSATMLFILAMLSKPTAVVTPIMAVVISVILLDRSVRRTIVSLMPWFVLMIPCLIWTKNVQPPSWVSPLPPWAKPAVAADAIAFYLYKLVWPLKLCIDYSRNPSAIATTGAIYFTWILPAAIAIWLWCKRRKHRPAVAGSLLFIIPLLPLLGFVPFEFQYISTTADHYLYMPMLGIAVLAAWFLRNHHSKLALTCSAIALMMLALRSVLQEPVWQDTRSLFNHALVVNPRSVASFDGLGFIAGLDARRLRAAGRFNDAQPLYFESIHDYQTSLVYDPNSVPSMLNLALDYQQIDRLDLARQTTYNIIRVQPKLPPGMRTDPLRIARLLLDFQDKPGALAWLDSVIRREPGNIPVQLFREHLDK